MWCLWIWGSAGLIHVKDIFTFLSGYVLYIKNLLNINFPLFCTNIAIFGKFWFQLKSNIFSLCIKHHDTTHTGLEAILLLCSEVSKDLFYFALTQSVKVWIMADPQVSATFDHYLKIDSEGHVIKIWEHYFKLHLLQSELGGFGIVPCVHYACQQRS